MHWIDWSLLAVALLGVLFVTLYTQRFIRSVADYVIGGRVAGRYLLTNAGGEVGYGVFTLVAVYEQIYQAGWIAHWWQTLLAPIVLVPGLLGFVTYRFRQTRAMTVAQYIEMRYSKRLRIFTGGLWFFANMIGATIVPAVQAHFFVYVLQLPEKLAIPLPAFLSGHPLMLPTYALIMVCYMLGALALVLRGGSVTLLTLSCIEGIISQALYIIVTIALLCLFTWPQISTAVGLHEKPKPQVTAASQPATMVAASQAATASQPVTLPAAPLATTAPATLPAATPAPAVGPATVQSPRPEIEPRKPGEGYSIVNPFDSHKVKDFNLTFVIIMYLMGLYGTSGGGQSAKSAHEARMAGILYKWREFSMRAMISFLALCCLAFLLHPDFADKILPGYQTLQQVDPNIAGKVRMPIAIGSLLPAGIKGVFCVIMVWTLLSGEAGGLQGRANIFVQDVLLPLRGKPFSQADHLKILRWSCVGVAAVLITSALLMQMNEYLIMWSALAGAIFGAGAGAMIIGGLYWKRGTIAGAWSSMLTGATITLGCTIYNQLMYYAPRYFGIHLPPIPLNGQIIAFLACIACVITYVAVSLATSRKPFDMDWLLHRGKYAVEGDVSLVAPPLRSRFSLASILNFDAAFTRSDKLITAGIFLFNMAWSAFLLVGTFWNLWHPICVKLGLAGSAFDFVQPWSDKVFMTYWFVALVLMPFGIGLVTTVWFSWGGCRDLRAYFRGLREERIDVTDDGTVRKQGEEPIHKPPAGIPVAVKLGDDQPTPTPTPTPK